MLLSLLLALTASAVQRPAEPAAPPAGDPHPLAVDLAGAPFTTLRWQGLSRPVLWPVLDRAGRARTRAWPLADAAGDPTDHVHQKSLWFAHGDVNGVDFWTEEPRAGRIEVESAERLPVGDGAVVVRLRCRWVAADGSPVCTDTRDLAFAEEDGSRTIDYAVTLHAAHGALRLGDTKEGTMAVRVARGLCFDRPGETGHALASTGARDRAVWGGRARWVAYHGEVDGATVGIALLDHPANLRHPTTWHARPYGLLAANPFGLHDFTGASEGAGAHEVPAGAKLRLRYRIVVFEGAADPGRLDAQWRAFAAGGQDAAGGSGR